MFSCAQTEALDTNTHAVLEHLLESVGENTRQLVDRCLGRRLVHLLAHSRGQVAVDLRRCLNSGSSAAAGTTVQHNRHSVVC